MEDKKPEPGKTYRCKFTSRAVCNICKKNVYKNKDGNIRSHGETVPFLDHYKYINCKGSKTTNYTLLEKKTGSI